MPSRPVLKYQQSVNPKGLKVSKVHTSIKEVFDSLQYAGEKANQVFSLILKKQREKETEKKDKVLPTLSPASLDGGNKQKSDNKVLTCRQIRLLLTNIVKTKCIYIYLFIYFRIHAAYH